MKIVICGSSGLIGKALINELKKRNHSIVPLVHESNNQSGKKDFTWNIFSKKIDIQAFSDADCVVNLAGSNIAQSWTKNNKESIYHSRIDGNNLLFETLQKLTSKPKRFVCASGIGYYNDPLPEKTDETGSHGSGFLADVCIDWERTALQMSTLGIETSIVRTGLVLANEGGVYPVIAKFKNFGLIPTTGSAKNMWSWIHILDLVNMYIALIEGTLPQGIYNGVSPTCCSQGQIAKRIITEMKNANKFAFNMNFTPNVPAFVLKLIMGEQSILALTNQNIYPAKALNNGFDFQYENIQKAIHQLIHEK